ncbi:MAG: T9SS type A sorting domain-containing protein [Bacteroidetes bacterium]|nr:T9SS type A sorting domain-containing protein [Bacteroidota bacterium]
MNGDAESAPVVGSTWVDGGAGSTSFGDASGTAGGAWYLTNSSSYPSAGSPMQAFHGTQFFNAGINYAAGDQRTLTQRIDLPGSFTSQDLTYSFDGYVASNGLFNGTEYNLVDVKIEYRNTVDINQYVFEYSLVPTAAGPTGWVHIADTHDILATDGVTYILVTLTAEHDNSSNTIEAYFDDLNLVANPKVLPVTLVDFHALREGDGTVVLNWETAQEQNSRFTEIQRSGDGKVFTAIGQVAAAGNSSALLNYTFTDKAPMAGKNYYRLRMVDTDGAFKYSKILQVATGDVTDAIGVYSNPFHDQLGVRVSSVASERLVLSLFDQTGRLCLRQNYTMQKGENLVNLYPQGLAAGVYLLQVRGERTSQTIRVLKQ